MHYNKYLKITGVGILVVLVIVATIQTFVPISAQTQTTLPTCSTAQIMNNLPSTTNVAGIVNIDIYTSPESTQKTVGKIIILANNAPIGRAQPNTDTYTWKMPWVTSLIPNGPKSLVAQVFYADSTSCQTAPYNINVFNSTASQLVTDTSPQSWVGPMNNNFTINTSSVVNYPAFSPNSFSIVNWSSTIGYLTTSQTNAQFSSGTTAGDGMITIRVIYGGATTITNIPITVKPPDAPLPTTDTTKTTTTSTSSGDTSTQTNQTTPTNTLSGTTTLQNNTTVQDCITSTIGVERFQQINNGQVRPSIEEINKINICFASSKYIVPSNFAPIAPAGVKELVQSNKVSISDLKNTNQIIDASNKDVIKINGKALPNSIVFIYIYSDPIVLTTKSDDQGNWEYVLEDPLEPGSHEIYAVVDKGDGVYERSNPLSFLIGTAEAADTNPAGLNLKIVGSATPAQSQKGLLYYIAGSMGILVIVVVSFILTIKNRTKNKAYSYSAFNAVVNNQNDDLDNIDTASGTPLDQSNVPKIEISPTDNKQDGEQKPTQ